MAWADVAVAAAGSTAWELLHMGVPTVFMVNADNQKPVAAAVEKAHADLLPHQENDGSRVGGGERRQREIRRWQ